LKTGKKRKSEKDSLGINGLAFRSQEKRKNNKFTHETHLIERPMSTQYARAAHSPIPVVTP
jgi:hypothetical protein